VITFHRTFCTIPGTALEAIALGKELCALVKEVTGVDASLATQGRGTCWLHTLVSDV